jgi:hypothetical protein
MVTKSRVLRMAETWSPPVGDAYGEDQRLLIRFLLNHKVTSSSPRPIASVLSSVTFTRTYRREEFQHHILGPLRRDPKVFVGTSSAGIFLVTDAADADTTLGFYTWRVRAELRHARNLRALAKRTNLFLGYESKIPVNKERAVIYVDESGTPDIKNPAPRFFVVGAVVVGSRLELSGLDQRFRNAFATIKRPDEHELKASALSVQKLRRVLRELSLLDYQWAAACFDKTRLDSTGFADPITFYRYAFQFLISDLLTVAWQADLVIDENSTQAFQSELETYLRRQNSGLPVGRLQSVKFANSSKERLVQLADLIAGAVRLSVEGQPQPLREIEHQMIDLQFWPPR